LCCFEEKVGEGTCYDENDTSNKTHGTNVPIPVTENGSHLRRLLPKKDINVSFKKKEKNVGSPKGSRTNPRVFHPSSSKERMKERKKNH